MTCHDLENPIQSTRGKVMNECRRVFKKNKEHRPEDVLASWGCPEHRCNAFCREICACTHIRCNWCKNWNRQIMADLQICSPLSRVDQRRTQICSPCHYERWSFFHLNGFDSFKLQVLGDREPKGYSPVSVAPSQVHDLVRCGVVRCDAVYFREGHWALPFWKWRWQWSNSRWQPISSHDRKFYAPSGEGQAWNVVSARWSRSPHGLSCNGAFKANFWWAINFTKFSS